MVFVAIGSSGSKRSRRSFNYWSWCIGFHHSVNFTRFYPRSHKTELTCRSFNSSRHWIMKIIHSYRLRRSKWITGLVSSRWLCPYVNASCFNLNLSRSWGIAWKIFNMLTLIWMSYSNFNDLDGQSLTLALDCIIGNLVTSKMVIGCVWGEVKYENCPVSIRSVTLSLYSILRY